MLGVKYIKKLTIKMKETHTATSSKRLDLERNLSLQSKKRNKLIKKLKTAHLSRRILLTLLEILYPQ